MAKSQRKDNGLVREIQKILLEDEDFLRRIVQENLQKILETEFEDYIQAGRYERTENRKGYRNVTYRRTLKTRVGVIELEYPSGEVHIDFYNREITILTY